MTMNRRINDMTITEVLFLAAFAVHVISSLAGY